MRPVVASPLIFLVVLLAACQSAPAPTPLSTYTPYPTYTPYSTYTPFPPPVQNRLPSAEVENLIWPTGPRDDVIPFEDAADFIDSTVTVEGTVARTHNSGSAVFLNFADQAGKTFTAVIFPDDWPKFPSPPENLFAGKLVRIEGLIKEYQGTPEIIITEPSQIEVALTLGEQVNCNCPQPEPQIVVVTATPLPETANVDTPNSTPAPTDTPSTEVVEGIDTPTSAPPEALLVNWQDAANYEGQDVTVEGTVIDTYNSGKVVFLNFDEDYQNSFKVAIFPDAWLLFPEPPEDYYKGKTVQVTGTIKLYQNAPEIIIDHPDQITILE